MDEEQLKIFLTCELFYRKLAEGSMTRNDLIHYAIYEEEIAPTTASRKIDKEDNKSEIFTNSYANKYR